MWTSILIISLQKLVRATKLYIFAAYKDNTNDMIRKNVIDKIKESKRCKNALAYLLNVNPRTIDTWLKRNDIMLTTALAVNIISAELDLKKSEILEQEKVTA